MPAISSLVQQLENSYPALKFAKGPSARWSPTETTVYYDPHESHADWVLLHETAHGVLGHNGYRRDVELLQLERAAWHHAMTVLAPIFAIDIASDFIETQLDTYRDWLHSKSTCPTCQSTGFEQTQQHYTCIHCGASWRVNIGIETAVRRLQSL